MKKSLPLVALFYSVLLLEPAFAGNFYWNTNAGDWTNAANWSNAAVPAAADYAYIDNGGQANLTAASATIWAVLVGVGNGNNKLAISNGGVLSNGANGGAGYVGYTSSNNTALVTGTGSLWQNDSDLYVGWGIGALRNTLVISNGGRVASANPYGFANFGGYTYIGYEAAASGNNALITGTDSLLTNTRSLFVGHTSGGNSLVVSNGGKVANADLFIGYTNFATNNSVQVTGTGSLLTNSGNIYVGAFSRSIYVAAPDGGYNSLTIANGGTAVSVDGFVGYGDFASYNTVQVAGTNSLWTNSRDLYVGFSGRGNRLVITNGGEVFVGGSLVISAQARATNYTYLFFDNPTNRVSVVGGRLAVTNGQINVGAATPGALYVTGGTVEVKTLTATNGTNSAIAFNGGAINSSATAINNGTNFTIGDTGSGAAFTARVGTHTFASDLVVGNTGSSNSLVITNGGEVFVGTNMVLGVQAGASNNSVSISSGRLVVTNGTLEIGRAGSGALNVTGGTVELKTLLATNGANSVLNYNGGTIISRGTTISNATDFYVGDTGSGATFIANGGGHSFASNMVVGNSGSGNSLIISNGATVTNFRAWIGYNAGSSSNSALVTGTNSLWTNRSSLRLGSSGSGNSLVISNGGRASFALGLISFFAESSNNTVQVTGTNSIMTSGNAFYFGYYGSASSLLVSNGGTLAGTEGYLGLTAAASNNSALITGANSLWTNSGQLWVGYEGNSNSLTVSAGGIVAATNIVLGSQAGSSGTLNIGRFGTNDSAGTINAPTIAFGSGTGVLNFNQSNDTTIAAAISGNGAVKQLGAGTTTLSASNTYTGDTTISAGTLRFSTENGAGGSRIIQTTLASLVEFLGGGRMTNQMTAFQYSFANSFEAAGQVTLGDAASSIAVASGATVTGSGSFIGTGGLTKKGLGTLSLTAANSFSGPLSVQAGTLALAAAGGSSAASVSSIGVTNGATLLVSQSHQVNNSAAVSLSGGTITRGSGVSETFGNLNLTQASFLDFGNGAAGNLTFGTYAPSALLTINNFNIVGSTLVFGSDLRSSITNSSLFSFNNGGIGSSSWNEGTSTFTITAIPEPSTYLAAIGLLALILWPLHRRRSM